VATSQGDVHVAASRDPDQALVVGDWVLLGEPGAEPSSRRLVARIERRGALVRRAPGTDPRPQTVAANVDVVFVVSGLGRDVNERRLERFLTLAHDAGAEPVIVLNKADLVEDAESYLERVRHVARGVEILVVSALSGQGVDALSRWLRPGTTVALLGTSGAGKSTLVNRWIGNDLRATGGLDAEGKGKHTTSTRDLVALPGGALVVDTPGLREIGLWSTAEGLDRAFPELVELARACRFDDCRHLTEPGCEVRAGLERGAIDPDRLASWQRLASERDEALARESGVVQRTRRAEARSSTRAQRRRLRDKKRR
jgi:ribosome biogenesis GTPase